MIEAFAGVFAAYAGYAGWAWWTATLVGALSGFQVANARLYRGQVRERMEAGDRSVAPMLARMSLLGMAIGAGATTAIYFIARWLLSA